MSKNTNTYPILDNLFNSKLRVKVLKFLFRSRPGHVGARDLAKIIQEPLTAVSREMRSLGKMGLIKKIK